MSKRTSAMHSKKLKDARQRFEDRLDRKLGAIVNPALKTLDARDKRFPVPAAAITALADGQCRPRWEPDGTWSALDFPRARSIAAQFS
jgi:hypothetical protein